MKKTTLLSAFLLVVLVFSLASCGKKTPLQQAVDNAVNQAQVSQEVTGLPLDILSQAAKSMEEAQKTGNVNQQAVATQNMLEGYAKLGAQFELKEYDDMESVDAPEGFPLDLIYTGGKISESSDSGSETYINKSVTVKTKAELKDVKAFYKSLLSVLPWKITSQSAGSNEASFEAENAGGRTLSVSISADPYSKLVSISLQYTGTISQEAS